MFNTYLYQPILQFLLWLSQLTGSLGLGIIAITVIIRLVLLPISLPAMRASIKMRDLQPEINKLKEKYGKDKQGLQQAQLALFQEHKINPAAGCLPYLAQFVVLIALYRVFMDYLNNGAAASVNLSFGWFSLNQPDPRYILPILAGVTQLILSLMILPAIDTTAEKTLASQTKTLKDDKSASDMSQMASSMQNQMAIMMPLMTAFIALKFPSGLSLYWVVSTLMSIVQQYFVSGWGGLLRLPGYFQKIVVKFK